MKKKVLYIHPLHPCGMDKLREKYEVIVTDNEDKKFLLTLLPEVHAVITRLTVIDAEMIIAGIKLEAVAKHGVGVDNIDIQTCNARHIPVLTTGSANSLSVAEHAFFAIGALAKRISYLDRQMRLGNWKSRDEAGSVDISGRTIGIVGLGRIGSELAAMASHGFHMPVLVFDPLLNREQVEQFGYRYCTDMDELCREADVVSLHVPLTPETQNLIDNRRLKMMKSSSYLVNFSRGGVVNELDLYQALVTKTIAGAALDAFEHEPPDATVPLFELNNVLLSPHCGTFSEDSRIRMSLQVAKGIDDVLSGRVPEFAANKAVLYR